MNFSTNAMATNRGNLIQRSLSGRKGLGAKPHDRRVQMIRVLLEGSFHRKLALREMSETVNLSPWRLAHLFKSETGMSPQRYLTLVRLQRAKHQLESTFLSIQEIGAAVGIPNPSQFTRSFKAAYGMTPIEYRKAHFDPSSIAPENAAGAMRLGSNNSPTSKEDPQ